MIYDCFLYNGEEDILEIRLNELRDVVDFFVICEATHTFSGKPKEITFVHKYNLPIIHLTFDKKPLPNAWLNEMKQREYILSNLAIADKEDLILLSDVDEIPKAEVIKRKRTIMPVSLEMRWFYYYLNYEIKEKWYGTIVTKRKQIKSMERLRRKRNSLPHISNAGWHFSFIGNVNSIVKKIESFSHQEYNTPFYKNKDRLINLIHNKQDIFNIKREIKRIEIDNTYPDFIRENRRRFDKYIARE